MPFFIPPPSSNRPSQQNTSVSALQKAIDNINQKIEYYDDLDPEKQDFLEDVKSGKDKTEAQKCYGLLKDLLKNVDKISTKEELDAATDTTEDFDKFCTIFPEEILDRYFIPRFNAIYDVLDQKVDQLSNTTTTTSLTSGNSNQPSLSGNSVKRGAGSDPSIVNYLNKIGWPSDFKSRAGYAVKYGIVTSESDYDGTSEQNLKLLDAVINSKQIEPDKFKGGTSSPRTSTGGGTSKPKGSSSSQNDYKTLLATDSQGNSIYYVRIGAGNYRPAVVADQRAGVQLFIRNPNPALRMIYPFIKAQNAPVRRASPVGP